MRHESVVEAECVLPVHMANALTGEAPFWDSRSGILWWIDIQGQRLLGFEPTTGKCSDHRLPLMPGLIAGLESGGLLLGLEDGLYPFDPTSGLGTRAIAVEADDARTRLNDGKADSMGRLWFGTMDKSGNGEPIGKLYCLDLDGALRIVKTNLSTPNAIAFAPDGKTFYFADSRTRIIERCAYDPASGSPQRSDALVTYDQGEAPDGVCVDADGGIWIAVVGGARIERRLPDGSLDLTIKVPVSRPTMPVLGAADGKTLFITSQRRFLAREQLSHEPLAGNLIAVRVSHSAPTPNLVKAKLC